VKPGSWPDIRSTCSRQDHSTSPSQAGLPNYSLLTRSRSSSAVSSSGLTTPPELGKSPRPLQASLPDHSPTRPRSSSAVSSEGPLTPPELEKSPRPIVLLSDQEKTSLAISVLACLVNTGPIPSEYREKVYPLITAIVHLNSSVLMSVIERS
jgi:hypothetical protein